VKKLIFHIPHASTFIPDNVRKSIVLSDVALAEELRVLTDHFTDKLFGELVQPEDSVVCCPVSRLVVDVERFADDALEPMGVQGMGAVYTQTHDKRKLRTSLQSRAHLMRLFYDPHHAALASAVERHLSEQGSALIVDCHSFPERALPYEADQTLYRPEICIGTDPHHTSADMATAVAQVYRDKGFDVAFNTPFAGTLVPLADYQSNLSVQSIMIEIRRDVYMDEKNAQMKVDWSRLASANAAAVSAIRQAGAFANTFNKC
jgi:N-formylglutamate deformylase